MVNDILEMVSENAFNQSSILSAVNGARALCLNEILIVNSLGEGGGQHSHVLLSMQQYVVSVMAK